MDILEREKSPEAWEYLKTLNLDCDELHDVITCTPFAEEAWELFRKLEGDKAGYLRIIEHADYPDIKSEAESIAFDKFELDRKDLDKIVRFNRSDRAAKLLLELNPTNEELCRIMEYTRLSDQAAEILLKGNPDNDELREIMDYSNLKTEAWERFVQQSPTHKEIIRVIQYTDLEDVAWAFLLEQNPKDEELMDLVNDYSETGRKQEEAARIVLSGNTRKEHLVDFIWNGIYVEEAWEKLKAKKPKYRRLCFLLTRQKNKVNEIAEYCLTLKPKKDMLFDILTCSDKKDEAAALLIQMPLELHEMADVIVESTIDTVLKTVSERVEFDYTQVNEEKLMRKIASKIQTNPDLLDVNNWHNEERHCIGGWAIALTEEAQEIEKKYGSEIAACLLVPNYTHLFFTDKETVLRELQKLSEN